MNKLKSYSNEFALIGLSVLLMAIYSVLLYFMPYRWIWGVGLIVLYIAEFYISYRLVPKTADQSSLQGYRRWRIYRRTWLSLIFLLMILILTWGFELGTCQFTSENPGLLCIVGIIIATAFFALFSMLFNTSKHSDGHY